MRTLEITLGIAVIAYVFLSPFTFAQETDNGNDFLKGDSGATKDRECRAYARGKNRQSALDCMQTCMALGRKVRSGQAVSQDEIDECNSKYDKFKADHEEILARRKPTDSAGDMPDVRGPLGSYNIDTGRVDLRTRDRMDWHMRCGSWAIVQTRSSGEFLRDTQGKKPLIRIVGIKIPKRKDRANGCTAERIEAAPPS